MAGEAGEAVARTRALAVLRIRGAALGAVLLPAAAAVVLHVAGTTGRIDGGAWDGVRWGLTGAALVVLAVAAAVGAVIARARPAVSPAVPVSQSAAPDLHRMVQDLADKLKVPLPSGIELTPDCDSWLEDRRPAAGAAERRPAPVLVIGSPFMWWMRVAELRALLAPVVAGTSAAADPEIYAARRFVRGLDAAVGVAAHGRQRRSVLLRPVYGFLGWAARLLLRGCGAHVAEMERGVAASASERAQAVDYGLRIVAQEQVGLAYAGWDRLLTRVALPAWRMGRWPSRLDAGVVAALTELSRRDRLADGFETRLGERPACDLLEEPGVVDEAVSLLAARLFHGGPSRTGPGWAPVSWARYPEEVVDRIWRVEAARLIRVLDDVGPGARTRAAGEGGGSGGEADEESAPAVGARGRGLLLDGRTGRRTALDRGGVPALRGEAEGATLARVIDRLAAGGSEELAARIGALVAQDEAAAVAVPAPAVGRAVEIPTPVYQLLPPRTGRELLADHVTAMVCCAAVDTAGADAGLDWLDGPVLVVDGARRGDLGWPVLRLVENGDAEPLRAWLSALGVHAEKAVRLA
jgi:MFS family permease